MLRGLLAEWYIDNFHPFISLTDLSLCVSMHLFNFYYFSSVPTWHFVMALNVSQPLPEWPNNCTANLCFLFQFSGSFFLLAFCVSLFLLRWMYCMANTINKNNLYKVVNISNILQQWHINTHNVQCTINVHREILL